MPPRLPTFAARIVAWQRRHGRRGLPWQATRDPYAIWLSEVMLQQTQVATVVPYFERFLSRFPDIAALAAAPPDEVMRLWSGLGYYARARNLHRAAREVVERHGGHFPRTAAGIATLPGVGRSTAAAIAAFAHGEAAAILDGNVKRVLARHFGVEPAGGAASIESRLWKLAQSLVPPRGVERYTQGLMDLGATTCTRSRPDCGRCPVRPSCAAFRDGKAGEPLRRATAKRAPARPLAMLVIVAKGDVLVEKRPPAGIWGGLWSLPEAPSDADPSAAVAERFGLRVREVRSLAPFTHAFTHFSLRVTPWLVRVGGGGKTLAQAPVTWLSLQEAGEAALPAPVKRLLAGLSGGAA